MRLVIAAAALALVAPLALAAQSELRPGVRVRVQAPGVVANEVAGTLMSRTADSLVIAGPELAPLAIPVNRITSVDISHGDSRLSGSLRGIPWGVGFGVLLGAATMSGLNTCRTTNGIRSCGPASSSEKNSYVGAMAVGSAIWGVIIGAFLPVEQWDAFDFAPRAAYTPERGASLKWSVAF